jgi:hypothetical protein
MADGVWEMGGKWGRAGEWERVLSEVGKVWNWGNGGGKRYLEKEGERYDLFH